MNFILISYFIHRTLRHSPRLLPQCYLESKFDVVPELSHLVNRALCLELPASIILAQIQVILELTYQL